MSRWSAGQPVAVLSDWRTEVSRATVERVGRDGSCWVGGVRYTIAGDQWGYGGGLQIRDAREFDAERSHAARIPILDDLKRVVKPLSNDELRALVERLRREVTP